jgi:hypothetical protein
MIVLTEVDGIRGYLKLPMKRTAGNLSTEQIIADAIKDLKSCVCGDIEVHVVNNIGDIIRFFINEDSSYVCGVIKEFLAGD